MYAKITDKDGKPISESNPFPLRIVGGIPASSIADGSITTEKFAVDAKAPLAGTADTANSVDAANISGDIQQSQVTGLVADLAAKLTATQAAAQADSTAVDVAGLVADFNTLLANLRAAGIIAT